MRSHDTHLIFKTCDNGGKVVLANVDSELRILAQRVIIQIILNHDTVPGDVRSIVFDVWLGVRINSDVLRDTVYGAPGHGILVFHCTILSIVSTTNSRRQ